MKISLSDRTEQTVQTYFEKAQDPAIKTVLPQKAKTVEEALQDYYLSLLPSSASYGRTIQADGRHVGDIWCYSMRDEDGPDAMLSFCVFEKEMWNRGIATSAVRLFLREIAAKYSLHTIGAFTYSDNHASVAVLEKNGFILKEEFKENGRLSRYYELDDLTDVYVCCIPSLCQTEDRWDYLVSSHEDKENWIVWRDQFHSMYASGKAVPYYGILDGEIICEATASLSPDIVDGPEGLVDEETAYLSAFRTNPGLRGKGYFGKLFSYMLHDLALRGYRYVTVGVEPDEEKNRSIYAHYGFDEFIKRTEETYPDGTAVVVDYYRKKL